MCPDVGVATEVERLVEEWTDERWRTKNGGDMSTAEHADVSSGGHW